MSIQQTFNRLLYIDYIYSSPLLNSTIITTWSIKNNNNKNSNLKKSTNTTKVYCKSAISHIS